MPNPAHPGVPSCKRSIASLRFDGRHLSLNGYEGYTTFVAVSGKPEGGRFDYSTDKQKVPWEGPIPEGQYWVQISDLQTNAWYRRNSRAAWGDHWIVINPYPTTQIYGRNEFFIHGGANPGSAGCIDLTVAMGRFVEALAREMKGQGDCYVPLTVRYAK